MMNPKPVNMKRGGDSDMDLYVREKYWVNHFFCVLDGYWLRTPPLTEPVRNAAA